MRLLRDMNARQLGTPSVVTVGNFDGLHLGHQALVRRCQEKASAGQAVVVVTFEPLPQAWFAPEQAPARLTSVAHKLGLLQALGVDLVWMLRFNQSLAALPAEEFVQKLLVEALGAKHVVMGDDFRFGRKRLGDHALLADMGRAVGFGTDVLPTVQVRNTRVSSTAIREALANAEFGLAAAMLGRPFSMLGRVGYGQQLGTKLGYPTANLRLTARPSPLQGVFAVQARWAGGPWMDGMANLGSRPALGGGELLLEVHLFDFTGDLYGQRLETRFIARLRDETDFPDLEAMVGQMQQDEQQARMLLQTASFAAN